jgi:NAD(P)-dependent dehydrogenase (short-subunit alcohol dehydrogenase family)
MVMSSGKSGNKNESFDGSVAFVTGATQGIGKATALAFAQRGASVAILDIQRDGDEQTASEIEKSGGKALALHKDVSNEEDVRSTIEQTVQVFGRLDYAFNNAGIFEKIGATADLSAEDFDRVIAVNLRGVFLGMKYQILSNAKARPRCDRKHIFRRRRYWLRRDSGTHCQQTRCHRADEGGCP